MAEQIGRPAKGGSRQMVRFPDEHLALYLRLAEELDYECVGDFVVDTLARLHQLETPRAQRPRRCRGQLKMVEAPPGSQPVRHGRRRRPETDQTELRPTG